MGKRVTVIGLGIEGVDVARYAAAHGATVTVTDTRPAGSLAGRMRELEGLPITYALGTDGTKAVAAGDIAFVSQSVPLDAPAMRAAHEHGIPVSSMTRWFFERGPGPTIGITGSSGKTTTTSLVAAMLDAAGLPHIVGGNIGTGLLGLLDGTDEHTWGLVELSHTQLQLIERGPHIAGILNLTPNHPDRVAWEDYVALTGRIVRGQAADD